MPERIQLKRTAGWRLPEGAVSVARPSRWGNRFRLRHYSGLARYPAALSDADWEYEGRVSADGARHDFHHVDGQITVCHVRYMTPAEVVECYRRVLTDDLTPSMISAGITRRYLPFTLADVRRELAGRDLACWCRPPQPCHVDVLLELANRKLTEASKQFLPLAWPGIYDTVQADDAITQHHGVGRSAGDRRLNFCGVGGRDLPAIAVGPQEYGGDLEPGEPDQIAAAIERLGYEVADRWNTGPTYLVGFGLATPAHPSLAAAVARYHDGCPEHRTVFCGRPDLAPECRWSRNGKARMVWPTWPEAT